MRIRRIAAQRIGDDATSRKPRDRENINLVWFATLSVIVMIIAISLRFPEPRNVVRVTVPVTFAPTLTVSPATTPTPTILPTTPTPLPTITVECGVMRAQVWLYDAPGGDQVTAGLLAGHQVTILERRDDFAKVRWENGDTVLVGWVAERWIEAIEK